MKLKRSILSISLVFFLVASLLVGMAPVGAAEAGAAGKPDKVKVLIGFKEKPGKAEQALVRSLGGSVKHTYKIIPSIAAELPEQAVEALSKNPKIKIIEPDVKAYAIGTFEEELNQTWGMVRIGEGTAHSQSYLGTGIKVGIIDSGIDYGHPELSAIYKGGYDFVNQDDDPLDIDGHGTHVAGTIAAARNENGVVGAAPAVELYALKALEGGSGNFGDIIAALDWCAANGIQVTNNSYGSSVDPGTQVRDAFDNSYAGGILHVAAAGNSGNPQGKGDTVGYPAKYASVMAVAASDINDKRASFSSTGPDVELIAPGVNIYSTWIDGTYRYASGTSMASPHVTGVAAQVWAANTTLGNTGVRDILHNTAENIGLSIYYQGYGLVRADLAAAAAAGLIPADTGSIDGTVTDANGSAISGASVVVENTSLSATTDSNGYYQIVGVPVGSYGVTASAAGYSAQTIDVIANKDVNTTQDFTLPAKLSYALTIAQVGEGTTVPASGTYTYEEGATVTLRAEPASGYVFEKWVINGVDISNAQTSITMDADKTATAYFTPAPVSELNLTVSTDKAEYTGNAWVYITILLTDQTNPVTGAAINVTVTNPAGSVASGAATTNADGQVMFSYRVLKSSVKGTYTVNANSSWNGSEVNATTTFIVK
ncbi:S8 family serine peptidase [Phosphitispora sp. TUW77]|uniref:S8 family serine peptidase n=1 Tax=Phosphitispora sp. TUW77 TaxID=3152361 RepID=UPI003AB6DC3C